MAVHWTITFRPLRTNDTYTVNIYDSGYSGTPVPLKGGAQPFSTQEEDDDDMFRPVRTQSGYLRIFDDGKDADGHAFNWKSMLPTTDTDRPVTLTNAAGTVLWQGFMQAQNFGGELYGNPQEREYPVQCALTVTEGTDVDYEQTAIRNFAYLLQQVLAAIPTLDITTIMVQGGSDARQWLLTKIDWQNFVSEDGDGNLTARYNLFTCLEDMCRFWGWTARTYRQTLFLTCADESSATTFLKLTRAELATLAGGETAGTTGETFTGVTIGSIFASTSNNDYRLRGPNKAVVRADVNSADAEVIEIYPVSVINDMQSGGSYTPTGGGFGGSSSGSSSGGSIHYTTDKTSFTSNTLNGTCQATFGSFNIANTQYNNNRSTQCVIRILKSFTDVSATAYAELEMVRPHAYTDGAFEITGTIWRGYQHYADWAKDNGGGDAEYNMYMRFGIGADRASAMWYNGTTWTSTPTAFKVNLGGELKDNDGELELSINTRVRTSVPILTGRIFIEFLGSDDIKEDSGVRSFDIADLTVTFKRNDSTYAVDQRPTGNFAHLVDRDMSEVHTYESKNNNNVRMEWNADCIFASENNSKFGFGVLLNPDFSYFTGYGYGGGALVQPEQHLADRVTAYWASAKRKIDTEVRSDALGAVSPQSTASLDGPTFYPVAIGNEWRDDVTRLTLVEI